MEIPSEYSKCGFDRIGTEIVHNKCDLCLGADVRLDELRKDLRWKTFCIIACLYASQKINRYRDFNQCLKTQMVICLKYYADIFLNSLLICF